MTKAKKGAGGPTIQPFGDVTEKQLRALGPKLDKLRDINGFKHNDLLWKHTHDAGGLLWHLVRHGLTLVSVQSRGSLRILGESLPEWLTAADIVAALKRLPLDMGALDKGQAANYTMLTPGVLADVDPMIVRAYLLDRAALLAAREELPAHLQLAIDFVRRRAGEAIDPQASAASHAHLVQYHMEHSLTLHIDVPRIADGKPVEARLTDEAEVQALAGLFAPPDAWAEQVKAWLLARVAEFRSRTDDLTRKALVAMPLLTLAEVIYLFGDGWWSPRLVLAALDARADAPANLFAAANLLAAEGTAPFRVTVPQIKKVEPARGGADEDEDDEDRGGDDEYGGEYDEYGATDGEEAVEEEEPREALGTDERVRSLAEILTVVGIERAARAGEAVPPEVDARFDLDRVFESDPEYVVRLRAALTAIGRTRAHAVIRRVLAKEFFYNKAGAILDLHFEPGLVEQGLKRMNEGKYAPDAGLLAFCEPAIVPALIKAQAEAPTGKDLLHAAALGEAILYILARASAAGKAWDPGLDAQIQLDRVRFSYGGSKVEPVLAMLDRLPIERYVTVLGANLGRCKEDPWRLVRVLRADTPPALIETIVQATIARRSTLESGGLGDRLRKLGKAIVEPLLRALAEVPAENSLMRALEHALDPEAFAAVKAGLGKAIETPEQELRRLAASVKGPKLRIYRLRRGEAAPAADSVGRIGGTPRGVPEAAVPRFEDEPMEHVITLDLQQFPELAARRPGVRALSLYLPDPGNAEHHESGALVWVREEELSAAPGSTEGAATIVVEAFEVPAAIFEVESGSELEAAAQRVRSIVYGSAGYVLGGPLWLQDGPAGGDPSFLFQFDESLCHINLGDSGVMYVFEGHMTWQCH